MEALKTKNKLKNKILGYSTYKLKVDILSSISVALLALPQSMAYALLLGLPPESGIIAAILGSIFTSALGSSRYLIAGPTNATSLILQAGTSQIIYTHFSGASNIGALSFMIISQIVMCVALMQIIISILKLGRLTQFISRSVMMGYILGVAITIIISQLFHLFAIDTPTGVYSLIHQARYLGFHLSSLNPLTTLIGVIGLLGLTLMRRFNRRIPRPLIMLITTAFIAVFLDQTVAIKTQWNIPFVTAPDLDFKGLLGLHFSFFEKGIMRDIMLTAFAISLLSIFELNSINRLLSERKGQVIHSSRDIFGLGISNLLSSFFLGTLPCSGSNTRSAFNYSNGAKSRLSGVFSGFMMLAIIFACHSWINKIPKASLAALLIVIAYEMIDFKLLKICLKTTKRDALVLIVTCISCLCFQLDIALFIGIALSVILYLRLAANTVVLEYAFTKDGTFRPIDSEHKRLDGRIRIINMEGNLFFGSIDSLQKKLNQIIQDPEVRSIILRFNNVYHLDASICHYLERLAINLKKQDKSLYLSEVMRPTVEVIQGSSVWRSLSPHFLYEKDFGSPTNATKKAYDHALEQLETTN